ncbi:MAG: hypothetical protein AAGG55_00270 [Pseudomonadota bacterium]
MWLQLPSHRNADETASELRFASLTQGEQVFVWSARQWLLSRRNQRCIKCDLIGPYRRFQCVEAISHLNRFMGLLIGAPIRPLELRHPNFPEISHDERIMLRVVQAAAAMCDVPAARAAAGQLVCAGVTDLSESARRYGQSLMSGGLSLNSYRQLTLIARAA